jgi:hypothetical protein
VSEVNHTERKHALLSASGADRWLNCTPSARLEEKFDASAQSIYAAEGTLAHEFGDVNLRFLNGEISKSVLEKELKKLRASELFTIDMESEVDKYVQLVMEFYNVAKSKTKDAVLLVEERFDFSHLVEQGFGTGDASIIADGVLDIIDLKYGKGVVVSASRNSQLMLYASGALRAFELLYDIHTIRMTIVQPRLDHVSSWEISSQELIEWGERIVKPKALKAYSGQGVQKAGDWCKWCKVKAMCATLAAKNVKLAQHEFRDPHLLTESQLIDVYKQQPMLVDWVNAVADYLLKTAISGKKWPGYKLVEGRSNRKWLDESKVEAVLEKEGYDEDEFLKKKLAGLTEVEKLVGKSNFNSLLGPYIVKPPGSPTLVPESDKRPAYGIEQAKQDFSD